MSDEKKELQIVSDLQKGYLTLPFNESDFKDFIKGLLGQPQEINHIVYGKFVIHLKDLQNFHDLLTQRINQQNNGKLLQLKSQLYYSDDSSVILSSYEELITYNEVKPVVCKAVRMTWSYLIQFADKTIPEKQEIEIAIVTHSDEDIRELLPPFLLNLRRGRNSSYFELNIRHTARSWGNDIETLLTNQINSILIKPNPIRKIIQKYGGLLSTIASFFFVVICLYALHIVNTRIKQKELTTIKKFIVSANNNINYKIDYVLEYIAQDKFGNLHEQLSLYQVVIIITGVILWVFLSILSEIREKSFLLLTRESTKYYEKALKNQNNKPIAFGISVVVSIIVGLISNYIFALLMKNT